MRLAILGGFVDSVNKRAESREPRAEKEAVEASLAGDVRKAFEKLGSSVAEVKADNIAGAVAARWLKLFLEQRENTGVMAPSHALRGAINGHIRERLEREGAIHGAAFTGKRLVSHGYTRAEKSLAATTGAMGGSEMNTSGTLGSPGGHRPADGVGVCRR